ncbi:RNA-directed DNA polymerase [uncultured Hydrogenophaga sp.]|uniref:RNA-directed DNA polymerase n=1 Tax=uncultured Hydrogenophaga sp. TaxID=199683 RepID=UPI00258D44FD|nr:RNA-directed DNA polymerase [uncultured Hydrogenophaga sp.]
MDRIERLLKLGYLPSQLPPAFKTGDVALHHANLYAQWATLPSKAGVPASPRSKSELFSVARAGHQRRATSLPNPIAQTFLSKAVVDNWAGIVANFRRSQISASHPRFRRGSNRAASLPSMQTLYERRLLNGAGYRYVLRTDISRFFPTIYTHSIPWALHGKAAAKKQTKPTPKFFGNLLDLATRQGQDGQTIGLPIGPDTSHIIAECIATSIDVDLRRKLKGKLAGFRYVDDYYLFFETQDDAEKALPYLVRSLRDFELQINFEKTRICRIDELEEDSWTHTLRSISIASSGQRQRSDINHYFEVARDLARRHVNDGVMVYALRRVGSVILRLDNWDAFEAQLCLVASAHPVTLQAIARLFSTYSKLGFPIGKQRLSRLVNSLITEHAPLEHHSEVAWCLWICKELGLAISAANVDAISAMDSSICALILLDLESAGALPKTTAPSRWKPFETVSALWEDQWMLSYEAGVRGWGGMSDTHVRADPHFDELRTRQVRFYDSGALMNPLITPKPNALVRHNLNTIAQLLELDDLDDVFEHEDEEDAYGSPIEDEDEGDSAF